MEKVKVVRNDVYEDKHNGERSIIAYYLITNDLGEEIGDMECILVNKPIRCLILNQLEINWGFRNMGYAKFIMQKLAEILKDKNLPAILSNATELKNSPPETFDMYERYGWQPLLETGDKANISTGVWMYFATKFLSDADFKKLQKVAKPYR